MDQFHIVETSHYLEWRERKAFVESLFSRSWFASQSNGFVHSFTYIFFSCRYIFLDFFLNKGG